MICAAHWLVCRRICYVLCCATALTGATANIPALPTPDGHWPVGVRTTEFTVGDRRLPAIIWYPAHGARNASRPYLRQNDAALQGASLARNTGYDMASISALSRARAHSSERARPVHRRGGFPLLIFSHGLTFWPAQNTALLERLASHGYIIVSIAHPGDSVDLRLADGTIATGMPLTPPGPRFAEVFTRFTTGRDHAERTAALAGYAAAFAETRTERTMATWRDDTLAVAHAITAAAGPRDARAILAEVDRTRLGLIGMSFGGATAATTCRLISTCRAAVNLDGQNFDPALFGRPVERPLLLMLSDWTHHPLFPGGPTEPAVSLNDYAYEPWATAGRNPDVVRVRVAGITHVGFTDLVGLMTGPKRDERVGSIAAPRAFAAIGDAVLAFVDAHVGTGDRAGFDRALAMNPELRRHDPATLRAWAAASGAASR